MAGLRSCLSSLLVVAALAAAAREEAICAAHTATADRAPIDAESGAVAPAQVDSSLGGETLLMQVHREASDSKKLQPRRSFGVTSDCASRLSSWGKHNAACLVKDNEKALLVYVPYGSAPGLDFPGGHRKDSEHACQTAERETCEETGHRVRAVGTLTHNVFLCEIVTKDACRNAVDEGFLEKQWVSKSQLEGLHFRGGTWGDKRALLANNLGSSPSSPPASSAPAQSCEVSSWPDKDHGLVCGDCKVLVDRFDARYGDCSGYCAAVGRRCAGAWEEIGDTCTEKFEMGCDQGLASSDAICHCGDRLNEAPTQREDSSSLPPAPPPASPPTSSPRAQSCDVSSWPDKDHGLVCGDCKVLVDRFDTRYKDCSGYCDAVGRHCMGAWEEIGDTCAEKFEMGCNQGHSSSDAICQCGDLLVEVPTHSEPHDAPAHTGARDACGCLACQGQGFSSRAQTCAASSSSDAPETCACLLQNGHSSEGVDSCGCRACRGEGWSSTQGRCSKGAETSPQEACGCAGRNDLG